MMKRRTSFAGASLSEGGVTEGDGGSPYSLGEASPKVTEGVRILWLSYLDNHVLKFGKGLDREGLLL